MQHLGSRLAFVAAAALLSRAPLAAEPVLSVSLPEVVIAFELDDSIEVGRPSELGVRVTTTPGQPIPSTVRGRIGMPQMGHWVTEEQPHPWSQAGIYRFPVSFPHPGIYRLRVWLDYPDGRDVKAALDVRVIPGQPLAPEVVP